MRRSNSKSVFAILLLVVSFACFLYVNTATIAETNTVQTNLTVVNNPVKETKMPDLKIITYVFDLIGRFMTAK
jgi:hypothetical protein